MKLGLNIRLGALLAAFGVLATGLTGLYSFTQSRELLVRAAERDLLSSTQVFSRRFSTAVQSMSGDVRLIGELDVTRSIAAGAEDAASELHKSALADTFHAMLRANAAYYQVRLVSARDHGLELVRVDREGPSTVRVLGDMLQEKAHFPYVFNALGLKRGEVFLSKIGINHDVGSHAALNRPTLYISSPVTTTGGAVTGLVVITVDITRVFDELKADLPPYRKLLLANEWGDYLIHPDPSQTFGFDQGRRVLIQESIAQVQPLLDGKSPQVLAQAELGDKPEPALGAFTRMPLGLGGKSGFVVLGIAEPLSEILQSTRVLGRTVLQIVLGFSAVAIMLALFAARVVTRPLKQMTREVKRFSSEHVVGGLPTQRQDEIGELARGFDEMQARIASTMAELDASRTHLAHMARHDNLTGLANRSVFIDRLEHAILSAKRNGGCLAVLFVDLDRFKHINDTHGHGIGDMALVQAARLLTSCVREVDTVARWGGDEFVILLEAMDEEHEARRVAQTLLDRFGRRMDVNGLQIDLGVSIGISMYPRDGFDATELIQRADEAMYLSKHRQGNRYSVFGNESLT